LSTRTSETDEVEAIRRRRIEELVSETGADWAEEFKPGSTGCHELLDRASIVADMIDRCLLGHPACLSNPEWYRLAEQASAAVLRLYQSVGAAHLDDGTTPTGA